MKKILLLLLIFTQTTAYNVDGKYIINGQRPLVVLIPSYKNANWYKRNLDSVFEQDYENYRVIYIDDCSSDGTGQLVEQYVKKCGQEHRCLVIQNKERVRALANVYKGVQLCQDHEIVLTLDGDDWFTDDQVFNFINELYADNYTWITYGQFISWPGDEIGYCKPVNKEIVDKRWYRKKWWAPGQLRTFYAWLCKQVELKDLIFEGPYFRGQFFPANYDLAICYPMMEMAGYHYKFIAKPIYVRNVQTPLNDFKVNKDVQVLGSKILRHKPLYERLEEPTAGCFDKYQHAKADMVIFSANAPVLLRQLLHTVDGFITNLDNVVVIYQASNDAIKALYNTIVPEYAVRLIEQENNLSEQITDILSELPNEHVLFAHDGMVFNGGIDIRYCIGKLEQTFAYGFYLNLKPGQNVCCATGLHQDVPPIFEVEPGLHGWVFGYGAQDWQKYNTIAGALYRKQNVIEQLEAIFVDSVPELCNKWAEQNINLEHVGLCFNSNKIGYVVQ